VIDVQKVGGSVWESNLLFTDTESTYEEALGWSWKDLASLGTLTAALLLPRFLIPLFSHAEPFQQLCCLLVAWRRGYADIAALTPERYPVADIVDALILFDAVLGPIRIERELV